MWAAPARAALALAAAPYRAAIALRNRHYDRTAASTRLPIPIISVGNITVGGTGKTPFVIDLAQRLERMGRSPAVVSRGYKADSGESNDEELLIRRRCPGVVCVADPDRAAGVDRACGQFGADAIVLDDAFQHRRLARSLDIVLVDATCPFGFGHLLPRGLLREPEGALRRADLIVVTRCDQVSRDELTRLERRLRAIAADPMMLRCTHRVIGVDALDGSPLDGSIDGKRAVVFAGVARPDCFAATVASLGVEIVGRQWWPDHHHYRSRDIVALRNAGRFPPRDLFLTTEKDAVKLARLPGLDPTGIGVVRVAIDFEGDGGTMLDARLRECLNPA